MGSDSGVRFSERLSPSPPPDDPVGEAMNFDEASLGPTTLADPQNLDADDAPSSLVEDLVALSFEEMRPVPPDDCDYEPSETPSSSSMEDDGAASSDTDTD